MSTFVAIVALVLFLFGLVTLVCLPFAIIMYTLKIEPTKSKSRSNSSRAKLESSIVRAQWQYDNLWGGKRK